MHENQCETSKSLLLSCLMPKREHFAKIYPVLQNNSGKKQSKATEISKLQALSSRENDPFKRLAKMT